MANFTRIEVISEMHRSGLVPLFFNGDLAESQKLMQTCYRGGARLLEFTARGDFAFEIFAELVKYARLELPGLILGVGSVTDSAAASLYMQLGANFVVTPVFRKDIAIVCNRRKILWSPGCGSLKEIAEAEEYGCEIIKLFPGGTYGPGFVKAIKGPQPWTSIMPTGGVAPTEENITAWFNAGVTCVGMGSKLILKDANGNYDHAKIESLTRFSIELIAELKNR